MGSLKPGDEFDSLDVRFIHNLGWLEGYTVDERDSFGRRQGMG